MSKSKAEISEEKSAGRFYTPVAIVLNILDLAGYTDNKILKKHVMENSCGDGAFLTEIVKRYCENALQERYDLSELKNDLETYVHGIELDGEECRKCVENVSAVAEKYGISSVHWDISCADTLTVTKYDGKMDFVLGNPPYIRVHHLGETFDEIKKFSFAQNGMTDLYIVFYEIGLRMLNERGVLGYITPNSFFNSVAGSYMRKQFVNRHLLKKVVDLKHYQAFHATTYTTIVILSKENSTKEVEYYQFDEKNYIPYFVETLLPDDYYLADNFYFSSKEKLNMLKKIFLNVGHSDIAVKNGYATLADDVFIQDFRFESPYVIPVLKASRGVWKKIFYPYTKEGKIISEETLMKDEKMYSYLLSKKSILLTRSSEKETAWYAFGRSQAISDTYRDKLSVCSIIRDPSDLKMTVVKSGTGVYGGLYITGNSVDSHTLQSALSDREFIDYVSLLGKYKSGGYYTFSSKDVKAFLDYKLSYNGGLLKNE